MSVLNRPYFTCEEAAFAHVESVIWASGINCPHCGSMSAKHYNLAKTRIGLRKCADCRKQFTVRVGTVLESSHVPLHKWLQAVYLMCASKKGVSSHQLHRVLEVTYKTAWFMAHRIREAMRSGDMAPFGGGGGIVEIDETFIGRLEGQAKAPKGWSHKNVVLTLVQRGGGARSFHIDSTRIADIAPIVNANIAREADLMTDDAAQYRGLAKAFNSHRVINHSAKEYVYGPVHTNTVEGYYSIFKRGMKGVYQHCFEKHLHRYLAEFDFRYSNRVRLGIDHVARARKLVAGVVGKRLTYKTASFQ